MTLSIARVYGGSKNDRFHAVCEDNNYIYAVGEARMLYPEALIVKFNKSDLTVPVAKFYGVFTGTCYDRFYGVCEDTSYVYVAGHTGNYALIIKFNKSDLSIAIAKTYSGASADIFNALWQDTDYLYAVGSTRSEGQGWSDALIVKFNKTDFSLAARKVYGRANFYDYFYGVCEDTDFVYAVGWIGVRGSAKSDIMVVKFNKSDLSISARKVFTGSHYNDFYGVCDDADYVYAVGRTENEGQGGKDALIVKFNKSDLSIDARKVYGGTSGDGFYAVCEDGDYVYAVGYTRSEGLGDYNALIVKFNKSDLSIDARKVYGGTHDEYFNGVYYDADYIYVVGRTSSVGQGGEDTLIVRFTKELTPATTSLYPPLVLANSALTLADSALALSTPALVLANSNLTLADPIGRTFEDSDLVLSDLYYVSGIKTRGCHIPYHPTEPNRGKVLSRMGSL